MTDQSPCRPENSPLTPRPAMPAVPYREEYKKILEAFSTAKWSTPKKEVEHQ
jgi:hypothetical protein